MIIIFNNQITKNYALELSFFRNIRRLSDGITFFEFNVLLDRFKMDHNPSFLIHLIILNHTIIEFNIYNVNHVGDLIDTQGGS